MKMYLMDLNWSLWLLKFWILENMNNQRLWKIYIVVELWIKPQQELDIADLQ